MVRGDGGGGDEGGGGRVTSDSRLREGGAGAGAVGM